MSYDVAIIGAGPAGLFASHYILEHSERATVALIDKGEAAQNRKCCGHCQTCAEKDRCSILCGVGGGGLFSDGKLILDLHAGGKLDTISNLSEEKRNKITATIVDTLKKHDGKSEPGPRPSKELKERWEDACRAEGLGIKRYDVLHMGTANLHHITANFADEICKNPRISLKLNCEVVRVESRCCGISVLYMANGESISAKNIIFAVGKTGSFWLKTLFTANGIGLSKNNAYLGIRLEVPQEALGRLFEYSFDPKIWAYYGDRKVKTHCFCRRGDIVCTNYMGFPVVGGHTRFTVQNGIPASRQSLKGNFNVLVSTEKEGQEICGLLGKFLHVNADGPVVQRLSEFLASRAESPVAPVVAVANSKGGNIRELLDGFDQTGTVISDFILRLGKLLPGILDESSLVYAPALEWFMDSVNVNPNMETAKEGWFAVGDGAGLSQGIVHSVATSLIAAEEICRRIGK